MDGKAILVGSLTRIMRTFALLFLFCIAAVGILRCGGPGWALAPLFVLFAAVGSLFLWLEQRRR
jgi:hypothetical protein